MSGIDLDRLTEPFPVAAHKQRNQGGKSLTYVEGHTVIHRLNAATTNNWNMEIKSIQTVDLSSDWKLVTAHVALTIPGLGTREHIGIQEVHVKGADLVKGAVTDALKKAATLFGVGLELYGPDYEAGEASGPPPRPNGAVSQPQRPSRETRPAPQNGSPQQQAPATGVKMASARQIGYLRVLANQAWSKEEDPEARLHGQVFARFSLEHLNDLSSAQASQMIEWFNAQDFIDETARPQPRVDPVEANQINYAMSEPDWVSQAPPLGEPGNDRYS